MIESKCGAAFPCQNLGCGLGPNNDVHRNKRRYGYHEYVPPAPKDKETLTLEERVEQLEIEVAALRTKVYES